MPLAAFTRLTDRLLAHLGEQAILRGEDADPPVRVNIEHGVELVGEYGEVTALRSAATISKQNAPRAGDTLDMIDAAGTVVQRYVLDVKLNDSGYSERYVLREV
jgi:hypothetical protein